MWQAKAPGDVKRYSWDVPVQADDALSSFTATASGVTKDSQDSDGNSAIVYLSGGTASTIGTVSFAATTDNGETIKETIYIPIAPTGNANAFSATADDVIDFALRPVVGINGQATASELALGLEWLNGMVAEWRSHGADVGAQLPLTTASVIYAPDNWLLAIKTNLRVLVAEDFGRDVSPHTLIAARRGLQVIKNDILDALDRSSGVADDY